MAYTVFGNTAVISVDGAMNKIGVRGLCMNVLGYDSIVRAIGEAEEDPQVERIVFRIDSPGGAVAGLDDLTQRIRAVEKPTITLFENLGASAALYAFTAADEVYATKTSELGSIGTIVMMQENEEKPMFIMTSSRAKNKTCDIGDTTCLSRIQAKIDQYEQFFYEALETNRGFNAERVESIFNQGDTIFAQEALDAGFIDGVRTFSELMSQYESNTISIPQRGGNRMEQEVPADVQAQVEQVVDVQAEVEQLVTEAVTAQMQIVQDRLAMAKHHKVGAETISEMILAKDKDEALKIALDALNEPDFEPMDAMVDNGNDTGVDVQAILDKTLSKSAKRK
jgi:ClpP class serine protease